MGKVNKNPKIDETQNEAQPVASEETVIKADENKEAIDGGDKVIAPEGDEPDAAVDPIDDKEALPPAGETEQKAELNLDDRKEYTVIILGSMPPLKEGDEKSVSGNVAKVLVKKGLAKLK